MKEILISQFFLLLVLGLMSCSSTSSSSSTTDGTTDSDTIFPTISSIAAPADKTYVIAENLDFVVTFSEAVEVTGERHNKIKILGYPVLFDWLYDCGGHFSKGNWNSGHSLFGLWGPRCVTCGDWLWKTISP